MNMIEKLAADMAARREMLRNQSKVLAEQPSINAPLVDRLRLLLAKIDPAYLAEGVELHTLRDRLQGKTRGRAHCGELGEALRKLGWKRVRCWRADLGGFRSRWYPPSTDKE